MCLKSLDLDHVILDLDIGIVLTLLELRFHLLDTLQLPTKEGADTVFALAPDIATR